MQTVTWSSSEISLRDYVNIIKRRRLVIILAALVIFAVGAVSTYLTQPVYRSTTRMLVDAGNRQYSPYAGDPLLSQFFMQSNVGDINTQIEIIKSEGVMAAAYRESGVPPGSVSIMVGQAGQTSVLDIAAESTNPDSARRLLDALPRVYVKNITWNRKEEINNAIEFMRLRVKEETEQLQAVQAELQKLRQLSKVYSVSEGTKEMVRLQSETTMNIRKGETAVQVSDATLRALESQRRATPEWVETRETITNPEIAKTEETIAALQTQRSGMLVLFKPAAPEVQELDARIAALRQRVSLMPATITLTRKGRNPALDALDTEIARARRQLLGDRLQLQALRTHAAKINQTLAGISAQDIRQARLEAEAERHKSAAAQFSRNIDDLSVRGKAAPDPVRVISAPRVAVKVAPRTASNLLYAAVVGLLVGICLALLQEYLDDRVNAPEDARRLMGVPVLGFVPLVEESKARLIREAHGGSLLESYRVLRTNVRFATVGTESTAMLVTSTVPGEGKSLTVANLAVAMALDGRSVIAVDTDLRRPTLHQKFDVDQRPGLTNVLVGNTALDDALQETAIPGLRVLATGPLPPNPAELLNSPAMRNLHAMLRERADVVIYDSPPFLASADAQVLSADVDGVLYVVQFGEARKSAIRHANDLLAQAHANLLGIVFNKITLSGIRDDYYYYGYYRYYRYYDYAPKVEGEKGRRRSRHSEYEAMLAAAEGRTTEDGAEETTAIAKDEESNA
ncbi:MAG: polysaccharide biosynthesis tyrosine autokinase [Chthonomonadales bacterium]|nr:polysaccharide biosynthesis tyrosine autokinase [Chthonomonadales bacterium]